MANPDRSTADNFWDLRDHAFDNPDLWQGLTAEVLFQTLAEYVETAEASGESIDWRRDVTDRLISWRAGDREG